REVVVDAGHPEVRLALEGAAQVAHAVRIALQELDQREDEVVGFVEAGEDLVLGHGHGVRAGHAPLHLEEAQAPLVRAGHDAALDVVAELLELAVGGLEAQGALDLHHDRTGAASGRPVIAATSPSGTTTSPPSTTGGRAEICASRSSSARRRWSRAWRSSARRRASCELSRAPACPARSWSFNCSARWSQ